MHTSRYITVTRRALTGLPGIYDTATGEWAVLNEWERAYYDVDATARLTDTLNRIAAERAGQAAA